MNKILIEWVRAFFEALLVIGILFLFFWPLTIDGNSMEGGLVSKDRVAMSRALFYFDFISTGDIIVCKLETENKEITVLKRLIGLPNDTIKIENGVVFINGRLLEENYVLLNDGYDLEEITLKEDEYFIAGDNRITSIDSRQLGPIKKEKIVGKIILKWYPFNKIKVY